MDMSGRTALITGASAGLGRRFAVKLAAAGAKVAVCARRVELLKDLVDDIESAGGRALPIPMDVADEMSVIAGMDAAEAALGPIDTVIANAGVNSEGMALDLPIEDFDRIMQVNVRGAFITAREGARRMIAAGARESGKGRIVLVASIGAERVLPGVAAYCASKAAVVMLGKALAREWATRGVNVNSICPGYIRTDINAEWFDGEGGKKQIAGFARRRLMDISDLDDMVLFLCSDASRGVTGASFTLDDGQSL